MLQHKYLLFCLTHYNITLTLSKGNNTMAVLLTPPYLQFFGNDTLPLAGGKIYTYVAAGGTFASPKATYTTEDESTENSNPIQLDSLGRPQPGGSIWIKGSYDIKITDALDNIIKETLDITAFQALAASTPSYFQSFSGNGSQTVFTTSEALGSDPKGIFVWVDAGLMDKVGYQIINPSAYTISGTTLTFASAPVSGTNNIYVSAPSLLVGAASAAADNAATSEAAASASAAAAATSQGAAATSATNAATSATNAATSESNAAISSQWATLITGLVSGTDYSSKAWAIGGTGTTTNNSKYWAGQAAALALGNILNLAEQSSTPAAPASGNSKLYFTSAHHRLYQQDSSGNELILAATNGEGTAGQTLISGGAGTLPAWGVSGAMVLLDTQAFISTNANVTFGSSKIIPAYDNYRIVANNIAASTNVELAIDFAVSGVYSNTWSWGRSFNFAGPTTGSSGNPSITGASTAVGTNPTSRFWIDITGLTSGGRASFYSVFNGALNINQAWGVIDTAVVYNGIRITPSTGTFAAGCVFKLYGIL